MKAKIYSKIFVLTEHGQMSGQQVTQCSSNQVQLVDVTSSWPQGVAPNQLGKHASDGPHIDWCPVLSVADQQLWRTIPPGRHVVRVILART